MNEIIVVTLVAVLWGLNVIGHRSLIFNMYNESRGDAAFGWFMACVAGVATTMLMLFAVIPLLAYISANGLGGVLLILGYAFGIVFGAGLPFAVRQLVLKRADIKNYIGKKREKLLED